MDLLKAVNRILPKLGEHPVTSLNTRHSTVALILEELESQVDTLCQSGWWFNEYVMTYPLTSDSEIVLPGDVLSFVPVDPMLMAATRGGKVMNMSTGDFVWDAPVEARIKVRVPFEQLPESAAKYAWYSGLCAAYVTDIGVAQDLQVWTRAAADAEAAMESEHLDQKRYSTARSHRYQRIRAAMRG